MADLFWVFDHLCFKLIHACYRWCLKKLIVVFGVSCVLLSAGSPGVCLVLQQKYLKIKKEMHERLAEKTVDLLVKWEPAARLT